MKALKILILPLGLALSFPGLAHEHHMTEQSKPVSGDSLYNLPSAWTTQSGKPVHLEIFRGQPVVMSMIYTHCEQMCPLTVEHMRKIETDVENHNLGPVRYILFSFDSVRDTPNRLRSYAAMRGLDPAHWTLMHGDPDAVRELAATLGISYRQEPNGEFDHSFAVTLLDRNGVIAAQQTDLQEDRKIFTDKLEAMRLDQR